MKEKARFGGQWMVGVSTTLTLLGASVSVAGAQTSTPCGAPPTGMNVIVSNDDTVNGTPGPDFICLGTGNNTVFAGAGDDIIKSQGGSEIIHAGSGSDHVLAGAGDDSVFGDGGADILHGGTGDDTISGGPGDDTIHAEGGDDRVNGGHGNDQLHGGPGSDGIHGRKGNDEVHGGRGNDRLQGGLGRDVLRGGPDNDIIRGNAGPDLLAGDDGRDFVDGRRGQDSCVSGFRYQNCEHDRFSHEAFEIDDWRRVQSLGRYFLDNKNPIFDYEASTHLRVTAYTDETRSQIHGEPVETLVDEQNEWSVSLTAELQWGNVVVVRNMATGDEATRVVDFLLDPVKTGSGFRGGVSGESVGQVSVRFRDDTFRPTFDQFEAHPQSGEWSQSLENVGKRSQLIVVAQHDESGNPIVAFRAPSLRPMFTTTQAGVFGRSGWTPGGTATIKIDDVYFDTVAIAADGSFNRPFVGVEDPLSGGRHLIAVSDDSTGLEKHVHSYREITSVQLTPTGHVGRILGTAPSDASFRLVGYDDQFRENYRKEVQGGPDGTFDTQVVRASAYYALAWFDHDGDVALFLMVAP